MNKERPKAAGQIANWGMVGWQGTLQLAVICLGYRLISSKVELGISIPGTPILWQDSDYNAGGCPDKQKFSGNG